MKAPIDSEGRRLIIPRPTNGIAAGTVNMSLPAALSRPMMDFLTTHYFSVEITDEGILYRPGPALGTEVEPHHGSPPSWAASDD